MSDIQETEPIVMTRTAFAKHLGVSKPYVTKLAKADRLVFTPDGRHIIVDESLARIEDTKDPAREDVAERWKAQKAAGGQVLSYSDARARKETALAEQAELDLRQRKGELCSVADVERLLTDLGTKTRMIMENLPDRISPEITPVTDEARTHALLVERFEIVLTDLAAWSRDVSRSLQGGDD